MNISYHCVRGRSDTAARSGYSWLKREDAVLYQRFLDSLFGVRQFDAEEIAVQLDRTPYAVLHRLYVLVRISYPTALRRAIAASDIDEDVRSCWFEVDTDYIDDVSGVRDFISNHHPDQSLMKEKQMNEVPMAPTKPAEPDNALPFEVVTTTYVFGRNVEKASDEYLIQSLQRIENQIASLKLIKTDSRAVIKRIVDLETATKRIAEILDARVA